MGIGPILVLALLALSGVALAQDKKCVQEKYEKSLESSFTDCFDKKKSMDISRMKQCWIDVMKSEDVVIVASDGQMTVDFEIFGEFGSRNSNKVGEAMTECHKGKKKNDDMYKEAARASQCVFDQLKKGC